MLPTMDGSREFYHSHGGQVIEERTAAAPTRADVQYVWSPAVGDIVLRDRDADGSTSTGDLGLSGSGLEERVYSLSDPQGSVVAITDVSGQVLERYIYDPKGTVQVLDAQGDYREGYSSGTGDAALGQYYVAPKHNFVGPDSLALSGTHLAWRFYYLGQYFDRIPGFYSDGNGGTFNPRQDKMMIPDPAAYAAGGDAYDPHVTLFGSETLGQYAGEIATVSAIGLGIAVSYLTAGLATPLVASWGLTAAGGTTLSLGGTVAVEAAAGFTGGAIATGSISYASGASAGQVATDALVGGLTGAAIGGVFGMGRYAVAGGLKVYPLLSPGYAYGPLDASSVAALRTAGLTEPEIKLFVREMGDAYLFRGTTSGFLGSPSVQKLGITPTSVDPVVATVFAAEGRQFGNAIIQFGPRGAFAKALGEGNVRAALEREVIVEILPGHFAAKAPFSVTVDAARSALDKLGIVVPHSFPSSSAATQFLQTTRRLAPSEVRRFVELVTRGGV